MTWMVMLVIYYSTGPHLKVLHIQSHKERNKALGKYVFHLNVTMKLTLRVGCIYIDTHNMHSVD